MKLKQFILLPLLYISVISNAQTRVKYYADFKAYTERNAQTLDNIIIEQRTNATIKANGGNDYKIYSEDEEINKEIKKTYWAIQNGEDLYLNCKVLMANKWYALVFYTGAQYLCFEAGIPLGGHVKVENAVSTGLGMGFKQRLAGATTRYNYLLDRQTGEIILLDKKKMLQLLENKPELKKKYKSEYYPHDPKVVVDYLTQIE